MWKPMPDVFTPYLLELVADAALKSFWRKNALSRFLRRCGVAEPAISTWGAEESKRDFLFRILPQIEKHPSGSKVLSKMARELAEQKSFPDLEGWEDTKEKKARAKESVAVLREHLREKDQEVADEKERDETRRRVRETQLRAAERRHTLEKLAARLDALGQELGTQEAGYKFQDWYYDMLDYFEANSRRPYVAAGRQIDGSVTLEGTTYLNELKFTREQVGAPDVDSLHKKVHDKADNTMGVLVSMSGFSGPAKAGASGPRGLLLLLDYNHLYLLMTGAVSFQEVVGRVRRHYSQTGEAYLPVDSFGS
jgi:hypothetical protein